MCSIFNMKTVRNILLQKISKNFQIVSLEICYQTFQYLKIIVDKVMECDGKLHDLDNRASYLEQFDFQVHVHVCKRISK